MDKIRLLAEVEELLRTMPSRGYLENFDDEPLEWLGRAAAVLAAYDKTQTGIGMASLDFKAALITLHGVPTNRHHGAAQIVMLIKRVQYELRLELTAPTTVVAPKGAAFDYFDGVRKIIEQASTDILVADPYLNADFASAYLPHVRDGVTIRLLGKRYKNYIPALVSAAKAFTAQYPTRPVEVRSTNDLHERHLFVDGSSGYLSGASFKDGPMNAAATLVQLFESLGPTRALVEATYSAATIET